MEPEQLQVIKKALAARVAGARKIAPGMCRWCGTSFIGIRKRRYCSPRCCQRAHYREVYGGWNLDLMPPEGASWSAFFERYPKHDRPNPIKKEATL
jgi:hypothetical protein